MLTRRAENSETSIAMSDLSKLEVINLHKPFENITKEHGIGNLRVKLGNT